MNMLLTKLKTKLDLNNENTKTKIFWENLPRVSKISFVFKDREWIHWCFHLLWRNENEKIFFLLILFEKWNLNTSRSKPKREKRKVLLKILVFSHHFVKTSAHLKERVGLGVLQLALGGITPKAFNVTACSPAMHCIAMDHPGCNASQCQSYLQLMKIESKKNVQKFLKNENNNFWNWKQIWTKALIC